MEKRKLIPVFIMLLAGAIAGILMMIGGYELHVLLRNLLIVLLFFYFLGFLLKKILDCMAAQTEKAILDEGEVIEKQPEEKE